MKQLLSTGDPEPVEWINKESASPILLLCEHAGQAIPKALGNMGISPQSLQSHIGWDIGAEALARGIADRLSAPLILQRYSRWGIDCNRPPHRRSAIPNISDGTVIPKNSALTEADRLARVRSIFDPLEQAIRDGFATQPRRAAFSIHSFTPQLSDGQHRQWNAGFLARADDQTSQMMMNYIASRMPRLVLGHNEPYQLDDASDWFIPAHAEARDMAHSLIEIRNDLITDEQGQKNWAQRLAPLLSSSITSASA